MLQKMILTHFKCFKKQEITLSPLTVFTGINGMGKSSAIQALLALRQSSVQGVLDNKLLLNGPLINLGTPEDVFYENRNDDSLAISIEDTLVKYYCSFSYNSPPILTTDPNPITPCSRMKSSLFNDGFAYLQAERLGPRTSYPLPESSLINYNRVGNAGEYCPAILCDNEETPLACEKLILQSPSGKGLRAQTEALLSTIGHSARIHVQKYSPMDLVNLQFSFIKDGLPTTHYRTTHVGFGLSYVLPIIVSILSSKPNDLIIIENPEAHLHPKGQAIIGHFLALAASCGVQLIIETHSDHLLNGIRVAVKKSIISPSEVSIHFFSYNDSELAAQLVSPIMDNNGRFDQWPDDFFDEWEKQLSELL
ncbi:MAG: DUF3696 domain-containing protein [Solidesulfovibrio sp.]